MSRAAFIPDGALPAGEAVQSQHLLTMDPVPHLVATARAFVAEHTPQLEPDTHDTLSLLTSEIVTNAVIHARTALEVTVAVTATSVVVTVHDLDLGYTEINPLEREGGRGLMLVRALAEQAGMQRDPGGGKVVWFRLARGQARRPADPETRWEAFE